MYNYFRHLQFKTSCNNQEPVRDNHLSNSQECWERKYYMSFNEQCTWSDMTTGLEKNCIFYGVFIEDPLTVYIIINVQFCIIWVNTEFEAILWRIVPVTRAAKISVTVTGNCCVMLHHLFVCSQSSFDKLCKIKTFLFMLVWLVWYRNIFFWKWF